MSVESYDSRPNECIFQNFPKFDSCDGVDHYVRILANENCAPLHANAEIEERNCLSVGEWPCFVSTHYSNFDESLAFFAYSIFVFVVHFVPCVPALIALKIRWSFLRKSVPEEFYNFRFRAKNFVQNDIFLGKQS